MNVVSGNLIVMADDGQFDAIIHGCNCFNVMGAGIAKQIRILFPEAFKADGATDVGDWSKLGTTTKAIVKNRIGGDLHIYNAYTQYTHWEPNPVEYGAIASAFSTSNKLLHNYINENPSCRIGIPKICAGLAGGNWKLISEIIEKEMGEYSSNITLVNYNG